MNILDLLLSNENSETMKQLSKDFDLTEDQTRSAVSQLVPALTSGLKRNTSAPKGMDELLEAIERGNHDRYVNDPSTLGRTETRDDGNDILGHIFGNKEVSREVSKTASQASGISSTLLKKMLPVLATIAMGAISKKIFGGTANSGRRVNRSEGGGLIGALLDSDGDGSVWDDLLSMGAKAMLR